MNEIRVFLCRWLLAQCIVHVEYNLITYVDDSLLVNINGFFMSVLFFLKTMIPIVWILLAHCCKQKKKSIKNIFGK